MADNIGDNSMVDSEGNEYYHEDHDHLDLTNINSDANGYHTHTKASNTLHYAEVRRLALEFFEKFKSICQEKGLENKYIESDVGSRHIKTELVYENNSPDEIPRIEIQWIEFQNNYVLIRMFNYITRFSRRVNLNKNDKWTKVIEDTINELNTQNLQYIETKTRLQNRIHEMGIEYSGFRKYGSTWQITCKNDDDKNCTIIQYDEKSKEYLFQRRFASDELAFALLQTERRLT